VGKVDGQGGFDRDDMQMVWLDKIGRISGACVEAQYRLLLNTRS
jgi:hypothetical protein